MVLRKLSTKVIDDIRHHRLLRNFHMIINQKNEEKECISLCFSRWAVKKVSLKIRHY